MWIFHTWIEGRVAGADRRVQEIPEWEWVPSNKWINQ